jgi:hypothetical protein
MWAVEIGEETGKKNSTKRLFLKVDKAQERMR